MIINVRGCSNKSGIIVSYLVENEENTGYDSFNAKKIIVKNKIDILAAIKKTLISSRKLPEISASDFVSTINDIGRKNTFDTSLKTIVKSVNDENMQSTMLTLSHVYFNNKPLPQVKAINIINGNMYFMVKMGSNYNLEPIKSEKIKCVIVISSLVNLYRRVKQEGLPSKNSFKKHYIQARPMTIRSARRNNTYHGFGEEVVGNRCRPAEPVLEERPDNPPEIDVIPPIISLSDNNWCSPTTVYAYSEGTSARTTNRQIPEDLANIDIPTTEGQQTEQRERTVEVSQPEVRGTVEERRPTERQAVVNGDSFVITEGPMSRAEIERDMLAGIGIAAAERRAVREAEVAMSVAETVVVDELLEIDEDEDEDEEIIDLAVTEERTAEVAVPVAEVMAANESSETDGEERRVTLDIETSEALAESLTRARTEPVERPRQIGERNRRSFVEYLRENQNGAFNNLRENNNTSTSHQ